MSEDKEAIEKVELFIQRLNDLDILISPIANEIMFNHRVRTGFTITSYKIEQRSLAEHLAFRIEEYIRLKDSGELKVPLAWKCLIWVQRAYTSGVIIEGQGLNKKLAECREENKRLQIELEALSSKYMEKSEALAEFERRFNIKPKAEMENKGK